LESPSPESGACLLGGLRLGGHANFGSLSQKVVKDLQTDSDSPHLCREPRVSPVESFGSEPGVCFLGGPSLGGHANFGPLAKYTVSEVRQRIAGPLAYARGSVPSRNRKGAVQRRYEAVFLK